MNRRKLVLIRTLERVGITRGSHALHNRLQSPYIRAINFHDVPLAHADNFSRQLGLLRRTFEPVGPEALRAFLAGTWTPREPGVILSFDDGLRSHAEVAAPLLEEFGFTGWFMVPGGFVATPPPHQVAFAAEHAIKHPYSSYSDARIAMTWDQLGALSERHVIGCHTWTHRRLAASLTEPELSHEITQAKRHIERELGAIHSFAWVGGEEWSYSRRAAEVIRQAGFEFSFMTANRAIRRTTDPYQLHRTNIEAGDAEGLVRFRISGLKDVRTWRKRLRVNRITRST